MLKIKVNFEIKKFSNLTQDGGSGIDKVIKSQE